MADLILQKAIKDLNYARISSVSLSEAQRLRVNVIRDLHRYKSTLSRNQCIKIQCENLITQAENEWSLEDEN